MKTLNLNEMESVHAGGISKCEFGVTLGCGIASFAFGLASAGAGFAFGLYCSFLAAYFDTCE